MNPWDRLDALNDYLTKNDTEEYLPSLSYDTGYSGNSPAYERSASPGAMRAKTNRMIADSNADRDRAWRALLGIGTALESKPPEREAAGESSAANPERPAYTYTWEEGATQGGIPVSDKYTGPVTQQMQATGWKPGQGQRDRGYQGQNPMNFWNTADPLSPNFAPNRRSPDEKFDEGPDRRPMSFDAAVRQMRLREIAQRWPQYNMEVNHPSRVLPSPATPEYPNDRVETEMTPTPARLAPKWAKETSTPTLMVQTENNPSGAHVLGLIRYLISRMLANG